MFFKKKDLPSNNDFVICTVKTILHHSVFVRLDEYENLEGLVHISEIAPGRIRNIRDFVKPDKTIVCKVLKVNRDNRQVDLSLRRVSVNSMKIKIDEMRQEEKAEKLLEFTGKQQKLSLEDMYKVVGTKILENFGSLSECFNKISLEDDTLLKKLGIETNLADNLTKIIKEKIKPPKIKVKVTLELKSFEPDGIEIIKKLLHDVNDNNKNKKYELSLSYVSAPRYQLELITLDKKNSDEIIENIAEDIIKDSKKMNIIGKWQKAS